MGFALSASLYVALFDLRSMWNAYNPKPNYEGD